MDTKPLTAKDAITDENNSFDGLLTIILFSIALGCLITCYEVFYKGKDFDFEKFGNGVAFIAGAGGVGYGAKRLGETHGRNRTDDT